MNIDRRAFLKITAAATAVGAKELLKPTSAAAQEPDKDAPLDADAYDGKEIFPSQTEKNVLMFREFMKNFAEVVKDPDQRSYLAKTAIEREVYELMVDDEHAWDEGQDFCIIRNEDSSAITLRGTNAQEQWEYTFHADGSATGSIPDEINKGIRIVTSKAMPLNVFVGYDFNSTCEAATS